MKNIAIAFGLLIGFRQKVTADAVFLISDRDRVMARLGICHDSSMEVSLLSALMAIYSASLKVFRFIHKKIWKAIMSSAAEIMI